MATVVASYRQLVRAYPTGGGDYEVASKNIGRAAGVVVASALLVDYVMTVAVSVSSGVDNIISAVPSLHHLRVWMAVVFVVLLAAVNLRGLREAGLAFAAPTYLFATGVFIMIATGLFRTIVGDAPVSESAQYHVVAHHGYGQLGFLALMFFTLRAFSSGCTALTGVEAIANGVPAFKPPKARNAQLTLLLMGTIAVSMFVGITVLALITKVHITDPTSTTCDFANPPPGCAHTPQRTVIAQVASAVFGGPHSIGFFYVQATTALILVLAANTAFNGFPLLGAILARDKNLPSQLNNRGDRLSYSNGIIMLAVVAAGLIAIYKADVTRLIQLYIIGVFTSFTLGQSGMVRHWNRALRSERDQSERRRMMRSRVINGFGASLSGVVLVIVIITKFTKGAYLVLIAMPILYAIMRAINKHYQRVVRRAGQRRRRGSAAAGAQPRRGARVEGAQADAARAGVRQGDPPGHPDRADGERRQGGHPVADGRVGETRPAGAADRARVALPRGDPADHRLHQVTARGPPARHRQRVHPGVRRRALVGAAAAQPVRAAAQGPAAVPARRDGHQRAVAARLQLGGTRARAGAPGRTRPPSRATRSVPVPNAND